MLKPLSIVFHHRFVKKKIPVFKYESILFCHDELNYTI